MNSIYANGHDGSSFIFNTQDGTWDFADHVDTSHPRYAATEDQMEWAREQAEGTLLGDIAITTEA